MRLAKGNRSQGLKLCLGKPSDIWSFPFVNEFFEGLAGTGRVNHKKDHQGICHDPQPTKLALVAVRGLINIIDGRISRFLSYSQLMRFERLSGPVHNLAFLLLLRFLCIRTVRRRRFTGISVILP